MESETKANHFADISEKKCAMIDPEDGPYSEITVSPEEQKVLDTSPSPELAWRALRALREDSATGPDLVSTRALGERAPVLAIPVAMLVARILETGVWPQIWITHWICPLYKKKAIHDGNNYRGIHLTSQLSKAMERMLQQMYAPFLYATVAFGPNQFA